jgi:hypothetical protein
MAILVKMVNRTFTLALEVKPPLRVLAAKPTMLALKAKPRLY